MIVLMADDATNVIIRSMLNYTIHSTLGIFSNGYFVGFATDLVSRWEKCIESIYQSWVAIEHFRHLLDQTWIIIVPRLDIFHGFQKLIDNVRFVTELVLYLI
jgi:hypothetical protein